MKFLTEHHCNDADWFDRVLCRDGSYFQMFSDGPECCITYKDLMKEFTQTASLSTTVNRSGGSVMVWDVFSSAEVCVLVRFDKFVTAEEYLKILREGLIPCIQSLFPYENHEIIVLSFNRTKHLHIECRSPNVSLRVTP